jgi:class 3 adenylate cyclase
MDDKPRILIVDDTPANIKILSDLLRADYALSVATNGPDALTIAASEDKPDLVLLDIMMPDMDGYEVCERLKADAATRDVPVIFVTAMGQTEDETRGFEAGGMDFITKPISPPVVKARVRSAVALKQKTAQLADLTGKLSKYLSHQVYESIFEGTTDAAIASKRKKVTIFFSDIVGFTATTERLEAEDMSRLLNNYLEEMSKIAVAHGGTIDKFMGDAIMVFFGDPVSKGEKHDALACVAMAMKMRDSLKDLQKNWFESGIETPFQVRAGINTGYCTVGNFGSTQRMEYTIIGGQVNIASRLETSAEPDQILISHETWSLIKDDIYCIKKKPLILKGIPHPVQTYQVVDYYENIRATEATLSIGNLTEHALTVPLDKPVREVRLALGSDIMTAAVVMDEDRPAGLVMNYDLMLLEDSKADLAIYFDLPVSQVMNNAPLVLEAQVPLAEAAKRAAARDESHEYDHILVTDDGLFKGVVTVRHLLERLVELHEQHVCADGKEEGS